MPGSSWVERVTITRREALTLLSTAAAAFLAACREDTTPALREKARAQGASLDCSDVAFLTAAELGTRTSNEYRQHHEIPDQFCLSCLNYVPPPKEGTCGTCKTVKGPINPDGWCKQWTQRRS